MSTVHTFPTSRTAAERLRRNSRGQASALARQEQPAAHRQPSLFRPGHNCWRATHADRVALMIDADAYFKTFAAAAMRAEKSIFIVGWDVHSQTRLHHELAAPDLLGDFLNFLAKRRRALKIRVLIWDYPVIFAKGREISPMYGLGWRPHRRVKVRYDDEYPVGAAQHQKLVIIDGKVAFCGGLDLTRSRWDTPEHRPCDPRRVDVGEDEPYAPFHDAMMMLDGAAAEALEEIARTRWSIAGGRRVPHTVTHGDPWPLNVKPSLRHVDLAISRTRGKYGELADVAEIQALYLDMIRAAKRSIYIENQYFTSKVLGDALAERLAEPDGPQIVAVSRLSVEGWLEGPSMGTLRTALLKKLRGADKYGHFHAYYPHLDNLPEGQCCDLHTKLLVVDEEWMQLGSANFCNRSLALDTECNIGIESRGNKKVSRAIASFRNSMLAEHLETSEQQFEAALHSAGSLSGAIEKLTKQEGRSLRPYAQIDEPSEAMLALASVVDPEKPVSLDELITEFAPEKPVHSHIPSWTSVLMMAAVVIGLAVLWRYTPLSGMANGAQVTRWAQEFASSAWAPFVVMAAYTPAAVVLFPRPLITLAAVVAFGPWLGFGYAFTGILLAALLTYALGRKMDRTLVRRVAGRRLNRLSDAMRKRGLLAMTAVRLVPLAPFAVVNIVAGAIRIRVRDFMGGSALGILPGTLVATIFGDQLLAGLRDPRSINLGLLLSAVAVLAFATWTVRRWLFKPHLNSHGTRQSKIE